MSNHSQEIWRILEIRLKFYELRGDLQNIRRWFEVEFKFLRHRVKNADSTSNSIS